MKSITLEPISRVNGIVDLPGSKSITNRALLLASLADGTTILTNFLDSDDTRYMLHALRLLGVRYRLSKDRTCCKVKGNSGQLISDRSMELFLGNSGTAMRLLTAVLCLSKNDIILTGELRMKRRPIGHLVDALRQGGAKINFLEKDNYPPLYLSGKFTGGNIVVDGSISSQFLTSLLIMAPLNSQNTMITVKNELVSKPYVNITLNLMKSFGVSVENQSFQRFIIRGNQKYRSPGNYIIESDASSASYFLAAAAIKGGRVKVVGIDRNSIQGDIYFADILETMGATIIWGNNCISCSKGNLYSVDMDVNHIPDAAMTIAIVALFSKGTTTLRNIYNWRVKETDRIFAMASELRKVGAIVKEGKDFIRIVPPSIFRFAKINTYNDHRIAMCFSLIALSGAPVTILNPKCTTKTFPDYFKKLLHISTFS